ncbi:O-antigen ligase family protein [Microbacterium sp. A93]|uniref:O-antigen ligase family protein n=1 Tax=Microbacterium sp. A93 TaxID=3450716 RepID=UPI003F41E70F
MGRPHLLILLVAVTFLPGLVTAAPHHYGQSKTIGLFLTLLIMVVTTQIVARWAVSRTFLLALAAFGVGVALTLLVFGEVSTFVGRASVLGMNPIGLGRMASLGSLLCVLMAYWGRGWWRALMLVAGAIAAFAATSTGSRGPLLAAGVAIVFSLLMSRRPTSPFARVIGVGGVLAGVYLFLRSGGLDSSNRIFSQDSSGRDSLWAESLDIALTTPGGLGFGGLYGHVTLSPGAAATGYTQYSHNILLETAVEGGWIALAGLLVVLVISFRRLIKESATRAGGLLLAVWTFAFISALSSSDLVGNRLLWVMIAVGLGLELWRVRGGRSLVGDEDAAGRAAATSRPTRTRRLTRTL